MRYIKILVSIFVVAIIAAFLFNFQAFTDNKKDVGFCISCHEMKPYYSTWLVTSHNQFGCLQCHQDITPATFIYKHWRNAISTPIEKRDIVLNEVCESCHTSTRNCSPPGDIIFPHELHVIKQIDCVDCHNNVVHLNVSEHVKNNYVDKQKEFTPAAFTDTQAKELIKKDNQILMPVCMRCHNGDMATDACNACHRNIKAEDRIVVNE
ncbi:cytochrome c3 family protein [Phosphitispora sp. TUW77]|uniref:cytochrome c3 family protein n=1 Tax=Phosphitispora sp. TUW77 TaxID=3152361 RepID=UPI003AB47059